MKGRVIHITLLKCNLLPERGQAAQQQFLEVMLQTTLTQMIVPCDAPFNYSAWGISRKNKNIYRKNQH